MTKFAMRRTRIALGISGAALATGLAMLPVPAVAQTLSTLQGRVEGAAAGTVVTARDTNTGQQLTGTVKADGTYTILGLRPSTYSVSVEGKPSQDVIVPVGQTVTADFVAAPAADTATQTIVVTGHRSQQELRTATVQTNVTPAQIENLPQGSRNFLNFAALAPGVTVTPESTNGARQFSAGAVSSSQTNVFVDGFSLKNPVNHGGVSGQNFSPGNPFPQLAVQEFSVDTQNFKAEYEQAGSAIITAVTKTGGEKFHGDAFFDWQPKSFLGQNYFDTGPKGDYDRKQFGGDLGGPIIKDVLHFYFAFEGLDQKFPSTAVDLNSGAADMVPTDIASEYNGTYPKSFKQRLYFGKLTLFASGADTINANGFLRREHRLDDYGGNAVPTHGHIINSDADTYELQWNHRQGNFLNEFTAAYNTASNGTPRATDGPELVLERQRSGSESAADSGCAGASGQSGLLFETGTLDSKGNPCLTVTPNGTPNVATGNEDAFLGANNFVQNDHQKIITVQDYATFHDGPHVIKGGVKLSFTKLQRLEDNSGNGSYYFLDSAYTGADSSTPFSARVSTVPVQPASANDTQIGAFIQDDWTPDIHWTVNAGIRWDYETNALDNKFVTPDAIATALRNYQPWKAAGIDADDYISNGHNRKPDWKEFQPRLGVSYDVKGDRDLIFFAGAGRYYDRQLFIDSGLEQIKDVYQSVPQVFFCNPAGGAYTQLTACSVHPGNPAYLAYSPGLKDPATLRDAITATGLGGDVWLLNNNTKLPFSDEVDVGIRKKFGPINASITLSHVRSHNLFQYVRGNRLLDGNYTDAGDQWIDDGFPLEGQLAGHSGKLDIGSNTGKSDYTAVFLQVEKPFNANSTWGFTSALTISRARTNVAQDLGGDEFYNGPDVNVYGWNYVAGSEKWRYVGTAIGRLPYGITLSGTLTLSSGPSFGEVINGLPNTPPTAGPYGNFGGVYFPHTFIGYKDVDVRIAKTFHTSWGHDLTLEFQGFNVFDFVNRTYSAWGAGSRAYDPKTGTISQPTKLENSTVGLARSFQAGIKYAF